MYKKNSLKDVINLWFVNYRNVRINNQFVYYCPFQNLFAKL